MSYENMRWYVPGGEIRKLSQAVFGAEHTLIAGTTGSGKSVLMNGIVRDLLRSYAPTEAKLVLIDPKQMELDPYRALPHCAGYADTDKDAVALLRSVVELMKKRNASCKAHRLKRYPGSAVYVVIDELHPLVTGQFKLEIRSLLSLLLTQARAANIHIIALTQIPNRASLPADIVSLFTMRIGLRTVSPIESRQIIGVKGCELLPLHGKALVIWQASLQEVEIPMVEDSEVEDIVSYWTSARCVA